MTPRVRRIAGDEWREVKDLRLRALRDPAAALAFLDTVENASAQPDSFWQERARDAAEGGPNAQFVAIDPDGAWYGSATVVPYPGGERQGLVVGVYVADGHRGSGAVETLFDACAEWAQAQGLTDLFLDVHVDNARARRAYERCGFVGTGEVTVQANGPEDVMRRPLTGTGREPGPLVP